MPMGFDLNVSTYNSGDILIENIQGELEVESYNGKIKANQISGSMVASTYNGPITVTFDKVKEGAPMSPNLQWRCGLNVSGCYEGLIQNENRTGRNSEWL